MATRDYYEVLGVAKGASADDIRKAYRALARKLHPDVNKAPDAAAKFNEVQQAYDVLSDESKRKLYDQFGTAAFETGGPPPPRGGGRGRAHYSSSGVGNPGGGFRVEGPFGDDLEDVFESIFGGSFERGARGGRRPGPGRGAEEAQPSRSELSVTFETAVRGGKENLRVEAGGKTRTIEVTIPAGVEDGQQLRVRGAGETGDLLLTIRVGGHPLWRRGEGAQTGKGLDLYLDLPLTVAEALLGATVPVPTLEGEVDLTVPPGTGSGKLLRLRGRGIKDAGGRVGDLYARVQIVAPPGPLSDAEAAAIQSLGARTAVRRDGGWRPAGR